MMKAVYIEWCDAISYTQKSWVDIEEAKDWARGTDWVVRQLGFVIEETEEYLLLASEYNRQGEERPDIGGVVKIPTTWIRKRVELGELIRLDAG